MKRITLEATDDNILNSIKDNTYNRCGDIKSFVEALDTIEGNFFISLDAKWGEGKTFYVRQIEKTLEFTTKKTWTENELDVIDELKPYFEGTVLDSIELSQSYLPIYYNAWLYDNHDDPLMSLIFTIVKKSEQYFKIKTDSSIAGRISALLSVASVSINNIQLAVDGEKIKSAFSGQDIFETVKTAEEIREMVKGILNDVIIEKAQRLVIFIDELDRCKPSYAIEMLERIKHYFDDERIIFVVSVNKEQLVHTISKYYGERFDSTGYLNKFFDLNIYMPAMPWIYRGNSLFEIYSSSQFHLKKIVDGLNEYYKLSIRDALIFKQRVSNLPIKFVNDNSSQGCCLSLFIPVIAILDIKDIGDKIKFLEGDSSVLENLSINIPAIRDMICRFGEYGKDNEFETGFEYVKAVYNYTFKDKSRDVYNKLKLEVSSDIKDICIKLCNGFY